MRRRLCITIFVPNRESNSGNTIDLSEAMGLRIESNIEVGFHIWYEDFAKYFFFKFFYSFVTFPKIYHIFLGNERTPYKVQLVDLLFELDKKYLCRN